MADISAYKAHQKMMKDPERRKAYIDAMKRRKKGTCLLYTSPSPRDRQKSRMPSSA